MRFLFTLLFISLLCTSARAQNSEGRDFWFTFLQHRDPGNTRVALISSRTATSGTISVPGVGLVLPFTVAANTVTQVVLPQGTETRGSEAVTPTGIHLESDDVVSVYIHQFFNNRSEASLVLPTPVLGTEYYVLGYSGRVADVNYPSTFAVVATEDETLLSIDNLTAATEGGRAAQTPIQVMLNQGQVYQVRAADGAADLTGTHITTSAPVALYSGASWAGVPANCGVYDNLLEINYPVSQWGRNYLGVPTRNNTDNCTVPIEPSPDGEYSYARVAVNTGSHTVTSSGCGVIVTAYGYGTTESYAYGGGAAFRDINANPIAEGGCLNDTVYFSTGLDTLRFRHEWTLEDGSVETRPDFPRFYN